MLHSSPSNFVNDNSTLAGKLFDYIILLLILVSLLVFALETLPNNTPEQNLMLHNIELFLIGCFSVEFFLRLLYAEHPKKIHL